MTSEDDRELWAEGFICEQGYLHLYFVWKRVPRMAEKLDTSNAWLPKPSQGLFKRMAKTSRECFLTMMDELGVELPAEAKDKDTWYSVMQEAYCTVARSGGAKVTKIEEEATS